MIRKTDLWKLLTYLVIFLIPTQLAAHFWPSFSFVYGIRVDYLAPTIYLTDILIVLLLLFKSNKIAKYLSKRLIWVTIPLLVIVFNVCFSSNWIISILRWLKIIEFVLFSLFVSLNKKDLNSKIIFLTILYSASFFSLIGIFQFFISKTTGLFWILGERSFTINSPGIALVKLSGQDFLRAYSTFSHPNSLGGYLGLVILFVMFERKMLRTAFDKALVGVVFLCFVLTFSFSSFAALLISLLIFIYPQRNFKSRIYLLILYLSILLSLVLPLISTKIFSFSKLLGPVFSERVELSYFSGKMISNNFLLGEGLNTFIPNIPQFVGILNYSWILQPVHNIFLLIFSELGVVGLVMFFVLLNKMLKNSSANIKTLLVFVITSGMFDHYWFTLQQNNLWLAFLIGIFL